MVGDVSLRTEWEILPSEGTSVYNELSIRMVVAHVPLPAPSHMLHNRVMSRRRVLRGRQFTSLERHMPMHMDIFGRLVVDLNPIASSPA
jgi:hypothetical protein